MTQPPMPPEPPFDTTDKSEGDLVREIRRLETEVRDLRTQLATANDLAHVHAEGADTFAHAVEREKARSATWAEAHRVVIDALVERNAL